MPAKSFHDRVRRVRPRGAIAFGLGLGLALGVAGGCDRTPEQPSPTWESPWSWPSQEGATSYRVQAWAGSRLLFEQSVSDTVLTLEPALRRALAPFDEVELQVFARDRRGEEPDLPWRGTRP